MIYIYIYVYTIDVIVCVCLEIIILIVSLQTNCLWYIFGVNVSISNPRCDSGKNWNQFWKGDD